MENEEIFTPEEEAELQYWLDLNRMARRYSDEELLELHSCNHDFDRFD